MKEKIKMTIELVDERQDFLELTINEDNTINGYSPIFSNKRLSIIGIGTPDGLEYKDIKEIKKDTKFKSKNIYVYFKKSGTPDPLPWDANCLIHKVKKII